MGPQRIAPYRRAMNDDATVQREVGLGRVVEDHLPPDAPDDLPAKDRPQHDPERDVGDASEQSFPASDPPTFMSDPATPREQGLTALPDDAAG